MTSEALPEMVIVPYAEVTNAKLGEIVGLPTTSGYLGKNAVKLYDLPMCFDIETTSFKDESQPKGFQKAGVMYLWSFAIRNVAIYGRTWGEFTDLTERLADCLALDSKRHAIVYVHNLEYEFQFIRRHFTWAKIMADDSRSPYKAITTEGIEFRCSLKLSGKKLEKLGEDVGCEKETMDYSRLRFPETEIEPEVIHYCCKDTVVVTTYIAQLLAENSGKISKLPLTQTGWVRKFIRDRCLHGNGRKDFAQLIRSLTLSCEDYAMLRKAFMGGFTHANPWIVGEVVENVAHKDLTSSYPTVMASEYYPMTRFYKIEDSQLDSMDKVEAYLSRFCCLFDVAFIGLRPKIGTESYFSESKCVVENATVLGDYIHGNTQNGRIVEADYLETTITDVDWQIVKHAYTWEDVAFANFRIAKRGHLPKAFLECVLSLYSDKTTLKGVEGKEFEYALKKGMLNSTYGMSVMNIVKDRLDFDNDSGEWAGLKKADMEKEISSYNTDKTRFTSYAWGVWITAYARRNLWKGILALGDDYLYSDTDSVFYTNEEAHTSFFDEYNTVITEDLETTCSLYHFDNSLICPKTIKGEPKPLGVWDSEPKCLRFKTLGAKRYLTETYNKKGEKVIGVTISGVTSKGGAYIRAQPEPFAFFTHEMEIPSESTGKLTHSYIDREFEGIAIDMNGRICTYAEKSAIYLEASPFKMSISDAFIEYLSRLRPNSIEDRSLRVKPIPKGEYAPLDWLKPKNEVVG